jgi:hypothetical protein
VPYPQNSPPSSTHPASERCLQDPSGVQHTPVPHMIVVEQVDPGPRAQPPLISQTKGLKFMQYCSVGPRMQQASVGAHKDIQQAVPMPMSMPS